MKTQEPDKEKCGQTLKVYSPPEVTVFGDAKQITLNTANVGSGDNFQEGNCVSPGNCG